MGKNFYISDTHFHHERMATWERLMAERRGEPYPFANEEERDAAIIARWNARIKKRDTVYILGDFSLSMSIEACADILAGLNGKKILILGNHDRANLRGLPYLSRSGVVQVASYLEISDQGHPLVLSHYPILFWNGQHRGHILLYGHVHNAPEWNLFRDALAAARKDEPDIAPAYNVGAVVQNFTPRTIEELIEAGEAGRKVSEDSSA
jgi:calcineurin-like phosphoesterase family protein